MLKRYRAEFWLLLGSITLALICAEILLQRYHPLADPYASLKTPATLPAYVPSAFAPGLSLTFRSEPGLPGMPSEPTRFTVNNLGFRGDSLQVPKPASEFRVFLIGGSTTETVYLDDHQSLDRRLQDAMRVPGRTVRVYNAGKSGDASYDHIAMFAHRIAHLEPDLVIIFLGFNDLRASIRGRDYLLRPVQAAGSGRTSPSDYLQAAATEFQVPRLLHRALIRRSEAERLRDIGLVTSYRRQAQAVRQIPLTENNPPLNPSAYATNLRTLIGIAKGHDVPLVLMTQATTWNSSTDPDIRSWHWMVASDSQRYPEAVLDQAMREYNDTTSSVAARAGVPVFDLARALPKSSRYFYDDVHFNVRGADTTAALLARFLAVID